MYLWRLKFYNCAGCFLLMNAPGTRLTAQQLYYILHTSSRDLRTSSLNISVIVSFWMLSINLKILCSRFIDKCRQTLTATAELNTIFIDTCYHFRRVKVYSGRLRRTQNVLLMISKYAKVLEYFAEVALQFTEVEWLPCVNFLTLLAVIWLHRRLQARAYRGIARVISNHMYSYHEEWTWRHLYCKCVLTPTKTYV